MVKWSKYIGGLGSGGEVADISIYRGTAQNEYIAVLINTNPINVLILAYNAGSIKLAF